MSEKIYTIQHRDNRGLATLVGFVTVAILTRLWWTGMFADYLAMAATPGEGMGSASYAVVSLVANVIYGIGTVVVLAWSGIWWLITDIISGIRQAIAEKRAAREITNAIATEEIAADVAGNPGQDPLVEILQTIETNMQSIADKIEEIDARVSMAEEALLPKPKTTRAKA